MTKVMMKLMKLMKMTMTTTILTSIPMILRKKNVEERFENNMIYKIPA